MTQKHKPREDNADDPDTPFLEWLAGGVGLTLFIGAIAVTALNAFKTREPPIISVRAEAAAASNALFRIEYAAFNAGDETAADIHLVARLISGGNVLEEQDARIDLLPGHSTSRGGVIFKHDPAGLVVDIVPVSYQDP